MTEIKVTDPRRVVEKLLSDLEENGIESIEIGEDYYWEVPPEQRYDPFSRPTEHTLGQLTDDLRELTRIADGETPTVG